MEAHTKIRVIESRLYTDIHQINFMTEGTSKYVKEWGGWNVQEDLVKDLQVVIWGSEIERREMKTLLNKLMLAKLLGKCIGTDYNSSISPWVVLGGMRQPKKNHQQQQQILLYWKEKKESWNTGKLWIWWGVEQKAPVKTSCNINSRNGTG